MAALFQRALGLELFQKPFEFNSLIALDAKGLRDVALGREAGILGDPVEDVGLGGKRGHAPSGSTARGQGHGKARNRWVEDVEFLFGLCMATGLSKRAQF